MEQEGSTEAAETALSQDTELFPTGQNAVAPEIPTPFDSGKNVRLDTPQFLDRETLTPGAPATMVSTENPVVPTQNADTIPIAKSSLPTASRSRGLWNRIIRRFPKQSN